MGSGWAEAARNGAAEAGVTRLAVDVIETDDAFTFTTDVPGVSREDVKVCCSPWVSYHLVSTHTTLITPAVCSSQAG